MTQFRADEGLAFMLQYENVAWYDAGKVRILDRRIYPAKIEFVRCKAHVEVMQAIRDMVTQSAGPYTAAAMGMALAAYECREKTADEQLAYLQAADLEPQAVRQPSSITTARTRLTSFIAFFIFIYLTLFLLYAIQKSGSAKSRTASNA